MEQILPHRKSKTKKIIEVPVLPQKRDVELLNRVSFKGKSLKTRSFQDFPIKNKLSQISFLNPLIENLINIDVNCDAYIPEGIIDSELFGHEKIAFTDATVNS